MPIPSRHRSRPQHGRASSGLLALIALCVGWTLALAHAAQLQQGHLGLAHQDSARVRVDAELRGGEPAPAPVANVAEAQASLRAVYARARYAPQQQLLSGDSGASAAWFSSLLLRLRQQVEASGDDAVAVDWALHRPVARRWPLPRSSCSDSDAAVTLRS